MKALKRKFLLINIILMLTISSCQKELITPENQIISSETEPQEIKYDDNLTAAVYGLLEISKNPAFRTIVNTEVGKAFDGDYNALLIKIAEKSDEINIDLRSTFNLSIATYSPEPSVHFLYDSSSIYGFSYYDEKVYVQIYIPFFDSVDITQDPIICLNLNDDDTLPGFKLDGSNKLSTYSVTEAMAKQNLVWVVSVNEREFGETMVIPDSLHGGTGANKRTHGTAVIFEDININVKKEGWGNGRADIYYLCVQWFDCSQRLTLFGYNVAKIKKSKVGEWVSIKSPNNLAGPFVLSRWEETENLSIFIYENDRRKKFGKTWNHGNAGCGLLTYTSKESPFGELNFNHANYIATPTSQTREEVLADCNARFSYFH